MESTQKLVNNFHTNIFVTDKGLECNLLNHNFQSTSRKKYFLDSIYKGKLRTWSLSMSMWEELQLGLSDGSQINTGTSLSSFSSFSLTLRFLDFSTSFAVNDVDVGSTLTSLIFISSISFIFHVLSHSQLTLSESLEILNYEDEHK